MRYNNFCSIIRSKVEGINFEDRFVSCFVRTAYESLPEGLTSEQQRAYAEVWVSGYQSGRLCANMKSRELLSGLGKLLVGKKA